MVLFCCFQSQLYLMAYEVLGQLLPAVQLDPNNTRDFVYRINKRRLSSCGISRLEINRLSTWSAVTVSTLNVEIFTSAQQPPRIIPSVDNCVCRLELDINSAQEHHLTINASIATELFSELVTLGNEIATKGEIP